MRIPPAPRISLTPASLRAHLAQARPTPVVLRDAAAQWPALKWANDADLAGLRGAMGELTGVDVEVGPRGRGYLDEGWERMTMGFGLFLDAFVLGRIPSSDPTSLPVGYLAQSPSLDTPGLAASFPPLAHYTAGPKGDVYARTLWVGRGSFTPLHTDPNHGLYTQVVGGKLFHLVPPEAGEWLEPSRKRANTSGVPVSVRRILGERAIGASGEQEGERGGERGGAGRPKRTHEGPELTPDQMAYWKPRLERAFALPGACEARLAPGDSVLIPQGWWHTAEGDEEPGVGVNAWFR